MQYIFRDVYNSVGPGKSPHSLKLIVIQANDEDEAWEKFAHKYAIGNFGLKRNSTLEEVKDYFRGAYGIEVYTPNDILEIT
jgi:hypothetical protein